MKKAYSFNVLGSKRCLDCSRRLKKRFEDRKKDRRCYKPCHINFMARRGHQMKGGQA